MMNDEHRLGCRYGILEVQLCFYVRVTYIIFPEPSTGPKGLVFKQKDKGVQNEVKKDKKICLQKDGTPF